MKIVTDVANFRLIMRRPIRLDSKAKRIPVEVLGEVQFPYTIIRDNCSLFKFILEYAEVKGDNGFVVNVLMDGANYCTINFQHIEADDGDYTKFFVRFPGRTMVSYIVD